MPFGSFVTRAFSYLLVFTLGVLLSTVFFNISTNLVMGAVLITFVVSGFYWWRTRRDPPLPARAKPSLNSRRYDKFSVESKREPAISAPVSVPETDHAMEILDDTQASLMFNQTSEGVIELIHKTFESHTTFLFLYQESDRELILQSFRSESPEFTAKGPNKLSDAPWFQRVIQSNEPLLVQLNENDGTGLFYYRSPMPVRSLALLPLSRKGQILGILGLDQLREEAFTDQHLDVLRQYSRLLIQSIQSIDGVYVKNRLRKIAQTLKEFSDRVGECDSEESTFRLMRTALENCLQYDRLFIWVRTKSDQEVFLTETSGQFNLPKGSIVRLESTLLEKVFQKQKRLYIADITGVDKTSVNSELDSNYLSTVLMAPIIDQGHCFGAVTLESIERDAYDVYEVQFLETLCNHVGLALARISLDKHLSAEARRDHQTGMDSYGEFTAKVAAEVLRAKRFGTSFSLMMFQVDYVKTIYETFGVLSGDLALEKIAEIIKTNVRQIDTPARLAHDRFGVLLVESKRPSALECAERILDNLEIEHLDLDGEQVPLTATIGLVAYGLDGDDVNTLMASANQALLQAKKMKERKIAYLQ